MNITKKIIYINLFLLIAFCPLFGQSEQLEYCNSNKHVYTESYLQSVSNVNDVSSLLSSATYDTPPNICVRIYPHLVRMDDGTGGRTEQEVWDMLNILNEGFAPAGISLIVPQETGITFLDDTDAYNQDYVQGILTPPNCPLCFLG